jgi:hypothetical protein
MGNGLPLQPAHEMREVHLGQEAPSVDVVEDRKPSRQQDKAQVPVPVPVSHSVRERVCGVPAATGSLFARRDGACWVGDPVGPGSYVERGGNAGQREGEDLMSRGDT